MQQLAIEDIPQLSKCFAPESAAIVGASTNPMKFGGRALKFCLERGYPGRLYPINASNSVVQGVQAFRSIRDLPEAPDIAVIALPASQVRDNLIAAAEMGCGFAVIYGAQFAEVGQAGKQRQDELLRIARSNGMRLIGPNCMGVISLASGFVASFTTAPEHHDGNGWPEPGSVSVASQSGAIGIQIFAQLRDRGLGLANWISTGNQADIDVADAIAYYASDPATKTISIYLEDASRGLKLVQAMEMARRARKPVVMLKVGTTPEGGRAATGHTASMYVENRVVQDLFAQFGVLEANSINELIDLTAACNAGVIPESPDVAAVSVSGGGAVMISDTAARNGLRLIEYPPDAIAQLKSVNSFVNDCNPIDISAPSMSNMEITGGHLKWGVEQDASTVIGYVSHIPLVPRTRRGIMPQLLSLQAMRPEKLIALAANVNAEDLKALTRTGVAVFDDPIMATKAVAKLVKAGLAFQKQETNPSAPQEAGDLHALLCEAGISMVEETVITSAEEAEELPFSPLVLKLSAPSLVHKLEIGGVETGLVGRTRIHRAYDRLCEVAERMRQNHPGVCITASPHVSGVEVLIGVRNDPHFGPLVLLGSGGTDCEIFDDLVYRKAPFDQTDAKFMVDGIRIAPKLDGWRGWPAVDRPALEEVLVELSRFANRMPSFEINPAMVTERGIVGVDIVRMSSENLE